MSYLGTKTTSDTVYVYFDSTDAAGGSITITGLALADIKIYKDGSVTQRSSTAGFTLLDTDGIDFDTITGIHGFSIDLSDNTDAGFYADGSNYVVVVDNVTVNGETRSFVAAQFDIDNTTLDSLDTKIDTIDTNVDAVLVDTGTTIPGILGTPVGADLSADIAANLTAINALNDISVADILTTQMTESYAANGVAPTLAEALFAIHQMLMDFSISGTSLTVEQLGGTTAFTVTLDDATNPTSANRV